MLINNLISGKLFNAPINAQRKLSALFKPRISQHDAIFFAVIYSKVFHGKKYCYLKTLYSLIK